MRGNLWLWLEGNDSEHSLFDGDLGRGERAGFAALEITGAALEGLHQNGDRALGLANQPLCEELPSQPS